jgi:hypothetical protein
VTLGITVCLALPSLFWWAATRYTYRINYKLLFNSEQEANEAVITWGVTPDLYQWDQYSFPVQYRVVILLWFVSYLGILASLRSRHKDRINHYFYGPQTGSSTQDWPWHKILSYGLLYIGVSLFSSAVGILITLTSLGFFYQKETVTTKDQPLILLFLKGSSCVLSSTVSIFCSSERSGKNNSTLGFYGYAISHGLKSDAAIMAGWVSLSVVWAIFVYWMGVYCITLILKPLVMPGHNTGYTTRDCGICVTRSRSSLRSQDPDLPRLENTQQQQQQQQHPEISVIVVADETQEASPEINISDSDSVSIA